ncbi:MAG: ATP-binding cassette domain-containing protein [Clostridia bacterium]|nr:ATP-binding cassette domain-containing protein [Clostridia bacterium]
MIEVKNVFKYYGNVMALDDVSFTVNEGEVVGFLGPNGAGKSTMMNIITGYLSSTSGDASVCGIDVLENPDEAKKKIGFLPEQPPLYREMKVSEYLNFVYDLKKCTLNRKAHVDEIMAVTKIANVRDRLIGNLSKGYRQRVGIAQALVGNPPVMIFDEPTVGLDPKQIIEIRNLIRNLGKNHTVILSTHILSEVQSVCDRILIINEGRLIADEKTENIARVAGSDRRYTVKIAGPRRDILRELRALSGVRSAEDTGDGDADGAAFDVEAERGIDIRKSLFNMLASKGWPIMELIPRGMSLEDVFVRIMDEDERRRTAPEGRRGGKE